MSNYPFASCLEPQTIYNKVLGQYMTVPCGHCKACRLKKSSYYTSLSRLESMCHRHTYFVTLTYANEYLPKCYFMQDGNNLMLCDYDSGEIIEENLSYSSDFISKLQTRLNSDYVPYLLKADLQLFIKRLRKYYETYFGIKIRYHAVGEYGPKHFRPHYHLLLWFEDQEHHTELPKIVSEKWPFGRVDVQRAQGDCAKYVSGYANSFSCVPQVLKDTSFRPFCVHSQKLGFETLFKSMPTVYSLAYSEFTSCSIEYDGMVKNVMPWRSYTSFFYPRCRSFASKTTYERLYSYTVFESVKSIFGDLDVSSLAKSIYYFVRDTCLSPIDRLSTLPQTYRDIYNYFVHFYLSEKYDSDLSLIRPEESVIRSIYTDLLCSKHFLNLCAFYHDYLSREVGIYFGQFLDVRYVLLSKIEKFYNSRDISHLVEFYRSQVDYFNEFSSSSDIDLFYDSEETQYSDKLYNTIAYKRFHEAIEKRFEDSIKHKVMNDEYNLLIY